MSKKKLCALAAALLLLSAVIPQVQATEAPIAENLELTTYRGVSVGGRLKAAAAEGTELTYRITTPPAKGHVTLEEDGHFLYTPDEGKRGRDYFGYRAMDANGCESQEATVIIRLQKRESGIRYTDTMLLPCDYAAHALIEYGLFTGECVAGSYVFEPQHTVSRGEFLAMCMKAAGVENLRGVQSTGYSDDSAISDWLKPYVSTALLEGFTDGFGPFAPEEAINGAEAAMWINRVFRVTDTATEAVRLEGEQDDLSVQAAVNLAACGVLESVRSDMEEPISRAEAAQLLLRAMKMAESRG